MTGRVGLNAELTIARAIQDAASRVSAKIAVYSDDRNLTYGELADRINRVGFYAKQEFGIRRGDRVLLISPDCVEYIELVAGISELGAAVVTLNPALSSSEILRIVNDFQPKAAFVHSALKTTAEALASAGIPLAHAAGKSYEKAIFGAKATLDCASAEGKDCFAICYTSGTTGAPKGVMLSHSCRISAANAMSAVYGCFGSDDHFLSLTPLCHGAGFAFTTAPLLFGGAVSLAQGKSTEQVLKRVGEGDISGLFIVPTHAQRFRKLGAAAREYVKGHALKALISNAAGMPQDLKRYLVATFGEGIYHETYGSTEAGIVSNIGPADQLRKEGSVGTPFPNVAVELLDEDGSTLTGSASGELFSRSPYHFIGYLNQPDQTAKAMQGNWVSVGDIASRDDEGFFHIVGRRSDMIITGGQNVYPREIEDIAARHPDVAEAAAIGIPDPEWGQAIHLFYVAKEKRVAEEDLAQIFSDHLAGYKRPKALHQLSSLPRNAGGKLLRKELKNTYLETIGTSRV